MADSFLAVAAAVLPTNPIFLPVNTPNADIVVHANVDLEEMMSIHVPDFRDATVESAITVGTTDAFQIARNFLQDKNWITQDLLIHMEQFYPQQGDITPGTGIRNQDAFKTACSLLFQKGPCSLLFQKGRIFASSKQLTQVVTLFLDKWGAKSVCLGKKICCFYHAPQKNKTVVASEKKYQVQTSQKVLVQCPFLFPTVPLILSAAKKTPSYFSSC